MSATGSPGRLGREVAGLRDAVTLLTRVPAGGRGGPAGVSATYYPVAGGGVGLLVGVVLALAGGVLSPLEAAVLAVAAEVWVTGALHLDGLADCADGTAGRDVAHRLAIMRDHAVGVYGTAAVVLDLGLRVVVLAALAGSGMTAVALVALLAGVYALSRWSLLHPARALGYARDSGTGRQVVQDLTSTRHALATLVLTLVLAVVLAAALPVLGAVGLAVLGGGVVAVLVVSTLVTAWARRRLGGVTGDVLGACVELSLAGALVVVSMLLRVLG